MKVFEPTSEIQPAGGEIAGGDEIEDGVLQFRRELGKGVASTDAGEGVEFVQTELVIQCRRCLCPKAKVTAGSAGKGGVEAGSEIL